MIASLAAMWPCVRLRVDTAILMVLSRTAAPCPEPWGAFAAKMQRTDTSAGLSRWVASAAGAERLRA